MGWNSGWEPQDSGGGGGTVGQSAAAVSHTGDTNETILATIPIGAGVLGANGYVRIVMYATRAGSAATVTFQVRFGASGSGTGGTRLYTFTIANSLLTTRVFFDFFNANATNSQVCFVNTGSGTFDATTSAFATAAIDTTAATEVNITGQLTNSGDTVTLKAYTAIAIPHA